MPPDPIVVDLPEQYGPRYAVVLKNVLTAEECRRLIDLTEVGGLGRLRSSLREETKVGVLLLLALGSAADLPDVAKCIGGDGPCPILAALQECLLPRHP